MKMIKIDDVIEYCESDIPPLRAGGQSVAVAALRRVIAVAKEYAVEAEPVKHGRWIWDSNAPHREHGAYKCSNCGCHSDFEENYCYNCGARMDGDSNG